MAPDQGLASFHAFNTPAVSLSTHSLLFLFNHCSHKFMTFSFVSSDTILLSSPFNTLSIPTISFHSLSL